MFSINPYGKFACLFGIASSILCTLADHSQRFYLADAKRRLLSPVVNAVLWPFNYLEAVLFPVDTLAVPMMRPMGFTHVFEHEAVVIFFTFGAILGVMAIDSAISAARRREFSFWYANGAYTGILACFLVDQYFGALVALGTVLSVHWVRRSR